MTKAENGPIRIRHRKYVNRALYSLLSGEELSQLSLTQAAELSKSRTCAKCSKAFRGSFGRKYHEDRCQREVPSYYKLRRTEAEREGVEAVLGSPAASSSEDTEDEDLEKRIQQEVRDSDPEMSEDEDPGEAEFQALENKICRGCGLSLDEVTRYEGSLQAAGMTEAQVLASLPFEVDSDEELKITDYVIYDEYNHLVAVDSLLIAKGRDLYLDGTVHVPGVDATAVKRLGPLKAWYLVEHFKTLYYGVSSTVNYFLDSPALQYHQKFQTSWLKKILIQRTRDFLLKENLNSDFNYNYNKYLTFLGSDFNHEFVVPNAAFLVNQLKLLYGGDGEDLFLKEETRNFLKKISGFIKKDRPNKWSASTTSTEIEEIPVEPLRKKRRLKPSIRAKVRQKRTPLKRKQRSHTAQPLEPPSPEVDSDIEILEVQSSFGRRPSVTEYDGSDSDVVITFS